MGRADLQDPEAGVPLGLSGQRRHEVVYPLGVLDGAGQGTAARPRHAPPTRGGLSFSGFDAPSPNGPGHGGPVPAGQERQPSAAQGQPSAAAQVHAGDQTEPAKAGGQLGHGGRREFQEAAQVVRRDPGPLGKPVQQPLVGGLERGGKQVARNLLRFFGDEEAPGQGQPGQRRLSGQPTARFHVGQGLAQGQDGGRGRETPYPVVGAGVCDVLFQGQEHRAGVAGQQPAGLT